MALGFLASTSGVYAQTSPADPSPGKAAELDSAADAADGSDESSGPEIVLPGLIEAVPVAYPAAARAARIEATVVLRLTIDADGRVSDAEVVEPHGHGFDEAALTAARALRFTPARRGDRAVAARILYEVEFRLEPEPEVEDPAPLPVSAGPATATPASSVAATEPAEPLEVTVRGLSAADQLRQSAEAVQVVETERAARESADLGDVLARQQGIGVRRAGGLGSETQFSLNGLTGDQVRFFIDEVPLEFTGFGLGVANVPVGLLERVEIYRGVVPIRFGADALGGAVNLVTPQDYRNGAAGASYQVGSFGTYRLTLTGRSHSPSGMVAGASAFADHAGNDYEIDVDVPNRDGQPEPASVRRFHDTYRALGGNVEFGVVDRPWAQRLLVKLFATRYTQQVQHNAVMMVPYGEVESGELTWGGTLRYHQPDLFVRGLRLGLLGALAHRDIDLLDASRWSYDWYGQRLRERAQDIGELGAELNDTTEREWRGLGRSNVAYVLGESQELRLNLSFAHTARSGENRLFDSSSGRDPRNVDRGLTTFVGGLEYQIDVLGAALENILFLKDYFYRATGETTFARVFTPVERETHTQGAGDALRYRFAEWSWGKASYEYATRLPTPDEVFGDGVLVAPSPELEPETSHNFNLGVALDARDTPLGAFRGELTGFLRAAQDLIVLLPAGANHSIHLNVHAARSQGVEGAAGWTSPGEYLWLDGNLTWLDFRNVSSEGRFADFDGDRMPNHPWLTANTAVRVQVSGLSTPGDEISLGWNTRYVHEFFRGWESTGDPEFKQVVDSQLLHSLVLTYLVRSTFVVASSVEVDNVTDANAYDFFGVQKPGRAVSFKGSLEY